jgi:hypothetical protein
MPVGKTASVAKPKPMSSTIRSLICAGVPNAVLSTTQNRLGVFDKDIVLQVGE